MLQFFSDKSRQSIKNHVNLRINASICEKIHQSIEKSINLEKIASIDKKSHQLTKNTNYSRVKSPLLPPSLVSSLISEITMSF